MNLNTTEEQKNDLPANGSFTAKRICNFINLDASTNSNIEDLPVARRTNKTEVINLGKAKRKQLDR